MKLKERPYAVSLTAPRKALLLLQRIEKRKKKEKEENPPKQCSTTTAATTATHAQKEREAAKMRVHEAIKRLFILSQLRVPTENGIKIELIVVNL